MPTEEQGLVFVCLLACGFRIKVINIRPIVPYVFRYGMNSSNLRMTVIAKTTFGATPAVVQNTRLLSIAAIHVKRFAG